MHKGSYVTQLSAIQYLKKGTSPYHTLSSFSLFTSMWMPTICILVSTSFDEVSSKIYLGPYVK